MIGSIFDAFGSIIPSLILFGVIYTIISFVARISDAIVTGLFFSVGVMLAGWIVHDAVTFAGGFIAFFV